MIGMQMLLLAAIAISGTIRISLMPKKESLVIILCWGIVAGVITYFMSGFTQEMIDGMVDNRNIIVCESVELLIFLALVFSSGAQGRLLNLYPGLMILAPIAYLSSVFSRSFAGINFMIPALLSGVIAAVAIAVPVFFFRYFRAGKESLYIASLSGIIICIIFFGVS